MKKVSSPHFEHYKCEFLSLMWDDVDDEDNIDVDDVDDPRAVDSRRCSGIELCGDLAVGPGNVEVFH